MNRYLIIYNTDCHKIVSAENLKDCILQFADYRVEKKDLFIKALQGCDKPGDCVGMYEQFGSGRVNFIFLIQETIYNSYKKEEDDARNFIQGEIA